MADRWWGLRFPEVPRFSEGMRVPKVPRLVLPIVVAAGLACSASPPPVPAASPVAPTEARPASPPSTPAGDEENGESEMKPAAAPPAPVADSGEGEARRRPRPGDPVRRELIVIDPGTSQTRPAPGELARRTGTVPPATPPRVTNENLDDFARSGQVTIAGPPAATEAADGEREESATESAALPKRDEAYWRRSARELREEWRRTLNEIAALEESAADLRWRFYAEDDPWVRDGQVKPEWDHALDRLREARRSLADYPRRLEELTERGREEGALPGWLREGIELEPRDDELADPERDPAEPVEPRTIDEGDRRDPGGAP